MGRKIFHAVMSAFSMFPPEDAPQRRRLLKVASLLERKAEHSDIGEHFWAAGNHMRKAIRKG